MLQVCHNYQFQVEGNLWRVQPFTVTIELILNQDEKWVKIHIWLFVQIRPRSHEHRVKLYIQKLANSPPSSSEIWNCDTHFSSLVQTRWVTPAQCPTDLTIQMANMSGVHLKYTICAHTHTLQWEQCNENEWRQFLTLTACNLGFIHLIIRKHPETFSFAICLED